MLRLCLQSGSLHSSVTENGQRKVAKTLRHYFSTVLPRLSGPRYNPVANGRYKRAPLKFFSIVRSRVMSGRDKSGPPSNGALTEELYLKAICMVCAPVEAQRSKKRTANALSCYFKGEDAVHDCCFFKLCASLPKLTNVCATHDFTSES